MNSKKRRKILVVISIISFVVIMVSILYIKYKAEHPYEPVRDMYYSLTHKKMYPLSKLMVSTGLYKPTFDDVYYLYVEDFYYLQSDVSFDYIKWLVTKGNIELDFVPISARTIESEISWFMNAGADINDLIYFIPSHPFSGKLIMAVYYVPIFEPILCYSINIDRVDLIPFLLKKDANPNKRLGIDITIDEYLNEQMKEYYGEKFNKTPRELLELKELEEGTPGKFSKEIELLKEYEVKYNKEHPNWKEELNQELEEWLKNSPYYSGDEDYSIFK